MKMVLPPLLVRERGRLGLLKRTSVFNQHMIFDFCHPFNFTFVQHTISYLKMTVAAFKNLKLLFYRLYLDVRDVLSILFLQNKKPAKLKALFSLYWITLLPLYKP